MTDGVWEYKRLTTPGFYTGILVLLTTIAGIGQDVHSLPFSMQDVLAHNDYQKERPFTKAYFHRVGLMEADLYFYDAKIVIAHDTSELKHPLDLEQTYLQPLQVYIQKYNSPYSHKSLSLGLMLDIKNHPGEIMDWILDKVRSYPDLFGSKTNEYKIPLIISGQRPRQEKWSDLPPSVYVDGRLTDSIPVELRSKIYMVSSSFSAVVPQAWSGGRLSTKQIASVKKVIDSVHRQNLKIRFWGVPDTYYFWKLLSDLGVDIIGCDHLDELARYLYDSGK